MSNYEERIEISGQTQISEINYIGKNSLSYFINPRSTLSGMYLDIESKYFTRNENILNNNSIRMKQLHISDRGCESEIWLTLPLVFPIATLHSVTHQRESQFCESNGGTLCFSPEETNISRLFSTIQGLSDIGAGFFQMVIAKFKGVVAEDIEVIKNEFGRIFKDESSSINGFIPFKPVGWRKRSFSKMNSTIPIEVNAIVRGTMINKQDSYYNAILISENYTESCKENIIKLGKLSNKFLEKIKFIYPSLEIIKVSDLEKDSFFEVTIRTEPMPSYVSSKGEDFDSKDKKFSLFQNSSEINNLKSIYLGDIRLINPYKTEVDTRIPCGLFKTFALISNHSIFEQSECRMATYIPFSQNRKKKSSQINYENSTETVPNSSNSIHQSQISDVVQYKISTPKLLTFGNHNKETSIKTPPPSNFFTNNSNCVSNISTCDLGYSTVFNSNWGGKSYSCTPTTKSSLNKISYTPFSSTEIDSSSWVSADFNIESTSIFSFEQDNQHFIPPRISSLNYMSNLCSNESINYSNNKLLYSNFISQKSSYEPIKNFDNNHLDVTQNSSDNNGLNLIKEAKELNINEIREPVFRNEKKSNKNQTIDIDKNIEFFEYDCSQYLENKDFDILNMLENIFSDNSVTNLENRKMGCNNHHFNDFENVNGNGKLSEKKTNQSLGKDYGEKLNLWSFELNNSSICIGKTGSDLRQKGKVSEFVPNELNYLNDHILFGQ